MSDLEARLAEALRYCRDDTAEVINTRVVTMGENYRPARLAAMRAALADADKVLAEYDAKKANTNYILGSSGHKYVEIFPGAFKDTNDNSSV